VIGVALGVVGLMASAIALPLTVVVGLAVLIRRGWLMAFLHTAPLAAIYGVWWLVYRPDATRNSGLAAGSVPFSELRKWVTHGVSGVFVTIGNFGVVAIALAAMLVVGLYLAWKPLGWADLRRRASMPLAMLVGAVLLFGMLSTQRWALGHQFARSSRYIDIGTALLLPALAVAAYAFVRRWRLAGSLVLVLFLIGVPANLGKFDEELIPAEGFRAEREFVLSVAYSDLAEQVSPDVYPNPNQFLSDVLTVGFLREARRDGKLPDAPTVDARTQANVTNRLTVSQSSPDDGMLGAGFECASFDEPLTIHARKGDQFGLSGNVRIGVVTEGERVRPTPYSPVWSGDVVTVEVPEVTFQVSAIPPDTTFRWCTAP
jgi:hypothetical protein